MSEKTFRFLDIKDNLSFFKGKDIEVLSISVDDDTSFNENMRGRIVNFVYHEKDTIDEHIEIIIDFKPFESYNLTKMHSNFYDKNQNPCLTWYESGFYKEGLDSIYIMTHIDNFVEDRDNVNLFKLLDEKQNQLHQLFEESGHSDYISFLEEIAL